MNDDQKKLIAEIASNIFISQHTQRPEVQLGIIFNMADQAVYVARRIVRKAYGDGASVAQQEDVNIKQINNPASSVAGEGI